MGAPKGPEVRSCRTQIRSAILHLLIGVDQAHLVYLLEDVRGQPGIPIASPAPLEWTCICNLELAIERYQTNFIHS